MDGPGSGFRYDDSKRLTRAPLTGACRDRQNFPNPNWVGGNASDLRGTYRININFLEAAMLYGCV